MTKGTFLCEIKQLGRNSEPPPLSYSWTNWTTEKL